MNQSREITFPLWNVLDEKLVTLNYDAALTSRLMPYRSALTDPIANSLDAQALFQKFGGHPTIRRLKQVDAPNPVTLERWRRKIRELLPDQPLPTLEQERDDPESANRTYASIMQLLIERTRDKSKFDLLFQENCQYGFARNLWALKPYGVIVSVVSLVAVSYLAYAQSVGGGVQPLTLVAGAGAVALLAAWVFWVTPKLVQVPSEAYADRLLAALDSL